MFAFIRSGQIIFHNGYTYTFPLAMAKWPSMFAFISGQIIFQNGYTYTFPLAMAKWPSSSAFSLVTGVVTVQFCFGKRPLWL